MRPAVTHVPGAPASEPTALDWFVPSNNDARYRVLREHLVDRQLQTHGRFDERVLAAMRAVPRHAFAPVRMRALAYHDAPLDIGHGQCMPQPLTVATMLDALALRGGERVLEIGTGSGYQAALLSRLAGQVHTIEIIPALARRAASALARTGCANVTVHEADGCAGWPAAVPYDAIVVTAAAAEVPVALLAQLRVGGCLVIPVGTGSFQHLLRVRKGDSDVQIEALGLCAFTPLWAPQQAGDDPAATSQALQEVRSACRQVTELLGRIDMALDPGLLMRLRTALGDTCTALDAANVTLALRRARFLARLVEEAAAALADPA
ncbi:MAG TPA: protein-L-isoaspartate(D-aspartate) O-methyltransferase [Haliangium sp.]|nr:protein-L-isoaspartate(D-aspartate) O-methyltransferase [Haliangium sp.]